MSIVFLVFLLHFYFGQYQQHKVPSISGAFRELFEWNTVNSCFPMDSRRDETCLLPWDFGPCLFSATFQIYFAAPTALAVRVRMGSSGNLHENSEMIQLQWYAPPICCWTFLLILVIRKSELHTCNQISDLSFLPWSHVFCLFHLFPAKNQYQHSKNFPGHASGRRSWIP